MSHFHLWPIWLKIYCISWKVPEKIISICRIEPTVLCTKVARISEHSSKVSICTNGRKSALVASRCRLPDSPSSRSLHPTWPLTAHQHVAVDTWQVLCSQRRKKEVKLNGQDMSLQSRNTSGSNVARESREHENQSRCPRNNEMFILSENSCVASRSIGPFQNVCLKQKEWRKPLVLVYLYRSNEELPAYFRCLELDNQGQLDSIKGIRVIPISPEIEETFHQQSMSGMTEKCTQCRRQEAKVPALSTCAACPNCNSHESIRACPWHWWCICAGTWDFCA